MGRRPILPNADPQGVQFEVLPKWARSVLASPRSTSGTATPRIGFVAATPVADD
jgi:hypothetical protein